MGNQVDNRLSGGDEHVSPEGLAVWLNRAAPAEEEDPVLEHLIHCAACREEMVMIRQATQPDTEIAPGPEFDNLLRIGELAAEEVWRQHQSLAQTPDKGRWRQWFTFRQPALQWAAAAVLLLAVIIPVYRFYRSNQPVERAMASMRKAWIQNRPIEARVTGGFPYLPYQVTRGGGATVSVNQGQLLAATAQLAVEVADRPTPHARHALGRLHLLKEEFAEAEEQLKLVIKEEPQNSLAHVDLASVYYERGAREESLPLLAQAAELLTKATEISPKLVEAWFNLALCHERMILPTQAQADWKKYLELDSNSPWAAEARAHLERLGSPNKSFVAPDRLAADLLAAAASNDEEKFRQLALNNFITAFNLAREDFLDKYLEARTAGDHLTAANYLNVMRRTARLAKDEKGEHYLSDLVAFVTDAKQPVIEKIRAIRTLLRQGDQSHEKGEYTNALSSYEKAVALAELIQDVCHAEHARYGLARIYIHSIETPERQRLRERLVRETEERNYKVLYARSLLALANAIGATQLFTKGLETSATAYKIAWQLGDFDTAANSQRFSGVMHTNIGNYERAVTHNYQALQVTVEHKISQLRACQANLSIANTFNKAANWGLSLAYQIEAFEYCKQTGNPSLSITTKGGMGQYYALTDQPSQAEALFRECLAELEKYDDKLGNSLLRTELNILLGDARLRQMRPAEAAIAYETTLRLVSGTEQRTYLAAAHQGLAAAWIRMGRVEEAERELHLSIELAEEIRKNINNINFRSNFRYRKLKVYRTMMDFQAMARGDLERAFYYAGLSQNRELFDTLAAQSEIKWESNKATFESAASDEVPSLRNVQKSLPDGVQLVQYGITDQRLLIWLITNNNWKPYKVSIGDHQLQQLCAEYLRELQSIGSPKSLNDKSAALHRKLIEPLLSDLDTKRVLVIVPDGILGAVPFAALFSSREGRYLIQDFAIVTIPSAAVLAYTLKLGQHKPGARNESVLILSNPKFDLQRFPSLKPLPATQQEEERISSYYSSALRLNREQATKHLLLGNIKRFDVIHLATHSIINEYNPLLSSVILASDSNPDDTAVDENLHAFEIFKLRLKRPYLIILSSCRSGLTTQSPGNELGGLAHAFFKAGIPAVIASLWEVEDHSAAQLMSDFHYYYRREKQSYGQALRRAQLKMLENSNDTWKHPYYWAPFQLSGNAFAS